MRRRATKGSVRAMTQGFNHVPVLAGRISELLAPVCATPGVIIDGTVGLGGHAELLLAAYPRIRVVGIDRDAQALELASRRLAPFGDRFIPHHAVFDDIAGALRAAGSDAAAGVLLDLGVSSLQLDSDERGFAYSRTTSLDMRMDMRGPVTAADVVNEYGIEELARVFRQYGEERFAHRIARAIARRRTTTPFTTTAELAQVCADAVPVPARRTGHPAKRVFQALRIEVNDELGALRRGLTGAVRELAPAGRVAVLSYHSLEDRIVKRAFASGITPPVPPGLPVIPPELRPFLAGVTRGAEKPGAAEVEANPRADSARLRVVERIAPVPAGWQVAA